MNFAVLLKYWNKYNLLHIWYFI